MSLRGQPMLRVWRCFRGRRSAVVFGSVRTVSQSAAGHAVLSCLRVGAEEIVFL